MELIFRLWARSDHPSWLFLWVDIELQWLVTCQNKFGLGELFHFIISGCPFVFLSILHLSLVFSLSSYYPGVISRHLLEYSFWVPVVLGSSHARSVRAGWDLMIRWVVVCIGNSGALVICLILKESEIFLDLEREKWRIFLEHLGLGLGLFLGFPSACLQLVRLLPWQLLPASSVSQLFGICSSPTQLYFVSINFFSGMSLLYEIFIS